MSDRYIHFVGWGIILFVTAISVFGFQFFVYNLKYNSETSYTKGYEAGQNNVVQCFYDKGRPRFKIENNKAVFIECEVPVK